MKAISLTGIIGAISFLLVTTAAAETPEWTRKNGIKQNGSLLTVVSTGTGPSLDLARRFAIDQAKAIATDQVNGSAYVRSMSIETEKYASFHSQVSSTKKVEDLFCKPLNDYVEDKDGVYTVWMKCEFELKKARVTIVDDYKNQDKAQKSHRDSESSLKSIEAVNSGSSIPGPPISQISYGEDRHLILSVVPSCESILIVGRRSRVIPCEANPVTFLVFQTDSEIVIRGPSGFAPKRLNVLERRIDVAPTETLEVYLDKM